MPHDWNIHSEADDAPHPRLRGLKLVAGSVWALLTGMALLVGLTDAVAAGDPAGVDVLLIVTGIAMGMIGGKVFLGFPRRWEIGDLTDHWRRKKGGDGQVPGRSS